MKIVISGGGTAGHIYPAIAVGHELERRGHDVVFAGTPGGLEARLAPEAGFPFESFDVSGFNRHHPTTLIKSGLKAVKSSNAAKKWLREIGAVVVVGFGGYVSIPVGKGASDLGIPLILHEQNSTCGMANKYLAGHASAIGITYDAARPGLSAAKCPIVLTGNPVRSEMHGVDRERARETLGIPQGAKLLFVFGGSLGARHINTAVCAMAARLMGIEGLHVIHVSGPKEYDTVRNSLISGGIELSGPGFSREGGWDYPGQRYKLTGYFDDMPDALAAASLVVSRSGATSLAEITAVGAASVLVPYPFATDDHQTSNARALVDGGAALMFADDEVESSAFADAVTGLLEDEGRLAGMRGKALALGRPDAAERVADLVEGACGKG